MYGDGFDLDGDGAAIVIVADIARTGACLVAEKVGERTDVAVGQHDLGEQDRLDTVHLAR